MKEAQQVIVGFRKENGQSVPVIRDKRIHCTPQGMFASSDRVVFKNGSLIFASLV